MSLPRDAQEKTNKQSDKYTPSAASLQRFRQAKTERQSTKEALDVRVRDYQDNLKEGAGACPYEVAVKCCYAIGSIGICCACAQHPSRQTRQVNEEQRSKRPNGSTPSDVIRTAALHPWISGRLSCWCWSSVHDCRRPGLCCRWLSDLGRLP